MNLSVAAAPTVCLTWLADAQRRPRALWLSPGPAAPDALPALFATEAWRELVAQMPCWLTAADHAALDPASQQATAAAGLRVLPAGQPLVATTTFPTAVSASDWVSGHWYLLPPGKPTSGQAASRTRALQLVQLVSNDADTRDIEAVLRQDATLSYHLLRLVNSLAMGGEREITSFAQAILILGRQQLRRWLNLMLFAARDDDPRSAMLMAHVATRARSLELLAQACGHEKLVQEQAFMVGMFSLLGVLFGLPLAEVLKPLPLGEAVQAALLQQTGELGELLLTVQQAEVGDHAGLAASLASLSLDTGTFNALQAEALRWMLDVTA